MFVRMVRYFFLIGVIFPMFTYAQSKKIPKNVADILVAAGKNRSELEKVISYCDKQSNPLKLQAAYFLIANMGIHHSECYYWADSTNNKIDFNELSYPNFEAAVKAFEALKLKKGKLHPVKTILQDIATIKSDFLIDNIEMSFKMWKHGWAKKIPFGDFCEYILPYRVSVEPLQKWRKTYLDKFAFVDELSKKKNVSTVLSFIAADERLWFKDSWGTETRNEPLPRLGAQQLLFRKTGMCEDIADLEVFTLRSQGIPASLNIIPYWATSTASHFVNTAFDGKMSAVKFDVTRTPAVENKLAREPSKVIRITYSKQPNLIADIEREEDIPEGFMRLHNYTDITDQYWETTDIKCELFPSTSKRGVKNFYVCVFNGLKWKPTWWGKVNNNSVIFKNMPKGCVFLPAYYKNGKIQPAGLPIAQGFAHRIVFDPDTVNTSSIVLKAQDQYLLYRPGRAYELFYWNNRWVSLGKKVAPKNAAELAFQNVPRHCLLLMIPEYTEGKERPFMMTEDNKRIWF